MDKEGIFNRIKETFAKIDFNPVIEVVADFIWLDWVALTIFILGLLYGIRKGMMRMLAEIVEMTFVIYMTMEIYPKVAYYLVNNISNLSTKIATPISFLVTLCLAWVFTAIIDGYLRKLLQTQLIFPVKLLGGAILGCLGSLLVLGIFVQIINLMPVAHWKKPFQSGYSVTGKYLLGVLPRTHEIVASPATLLSSFTTAKSSPKSS